MNTHAHATHPLTRNAATTNDSRVRSLRVAVSRLASWWGDDAVTARFTAARERDQRLLDRVGSR
jgi:hypothetical protein